MKKSLSVFINIILLTISISSCTMIKKTENNISSNSKEGKPFRFENYKTEEEAKDALNKMFPEGSNVKELVSFLEKSKFVCNVLKVKSNVPFKFVDENQKEYDFSKLISCSISSNEVLSGSIQNVIIKFDHNNNIMNINISFHYKGL